MALVSDQPHTPVLCALSLSGTSSTNSRVLTAVIQNNDIAAKLFVGKITHIHIGRKKNRKNKKPR